VGNSLNSNRFEQITKDFLIAFKAVFKKMWRHTKTDRWGEFVITPALMMGMDDIIL
jgi:DNA-binding ferritin-like protein (Dps family)